MPKVTPRAPIRADHRFIYQIVSVVVGGKVLYIPSEFTRVSRVFSRLGGSWERVFKGSPEDIELLKKVIKTAEKGGHLTKKEKWL